MKVIFSFMLFVVLFPLYALNFVENADLKKFSLKNGEPAGWTNFPKLSGSRSPHPDDSKRFVLELASPKIGKKVHWMGTLKKIKTGQVYLLSAKVKVPLNQKFRIYVERNKPVFKSFNGSHWQNGTGKWQIIFFEFSYKIPGSNPYIVFNIENTGKCFATDFKVVAKK